MSARNGETWMQTDRPGEALRRLEVFLPSGGTPSSREGARPPLPHPNTSVRGSSWLKPPALARHHGNHLPELVYDRRSWNRTELIRHPPPEECGKGQKETPRGRHLPESSSLASILGEQGRAARKDSESEGLAETPWKLTPSP